MAVRQHFTREMAIEVRCQWFFLVDKEVTVFSSPTVSIFRSASSQSFMETYLSSPVASQVLSLASHSSFRREINFSEDLMRPLLISLIISIVLSGSYALGADDGDNEVTARNGTKSPTS